MPARRPGSDRAISPPPGLSGNLNDGLIGDWVEYARFGNDSMEHVNPRSPFVLDTRELNRRAGTKRDYQREMPAPVQLGLDMIGVPEGTPLALTVRLESVTEGILATGTVTGEVAGECGRCLNGFRDGLAVDFMELFAYRDSNTEETTDADEIPRLEGDLLDLEPVVRDAVVLSLPLTPLCQPDCAGLCPQCGERLDDLPAGHGHEQLDPRWAALAERFGADGSSATGDGAPSTTDNEE